MFSFFKKIGDFFLCMLQEDCKYSIKKFLAYIFSILIVYVVIFTDKEFYELLVFVAVLLGIRAYEKGKEMALGYRRKTSDNKEVL